MFLLHDDMARAIDHLNSYQLVAQVHFRDARGWAFLLARPVFARTQILQRRRRRE